MNYPARVVVAVALAALCSAACESTKSSNPLSPSVAGPIGGVTITAPKPLTPANGAELKTTDPVNLLLENSTSSSQRPFWFEIQVSTEQDFSAIIHTAQKVTPGGDGRTSYVVPLTFTANRTYYWRARAVDGANTGPYSTTPMFRVVDAVHIETPLPVSPTGGLELDSTTPTLIVRNTAVLGTTAAVVYRFELAADANFTQLIAIWSAVRGGGDTTQVTGSPLGVGTEYFWRVNASDGSFTSPYSDVQHFKTKSATPTPPPTPPGGGGGGGGGGSTGGPWPSDGAQLIAWTQSHYPQYLVPGGNRTANMMFVRDRMIEAGLCGGMQLGWNLKRGGPDISLDYITWNTGGRWVGVDIAHDADNQSIPLQLTWAPMPDDPYATYGGYSGKLPCQ